MPVKALFFVVLSNFLIFPGSVGFALSVQNLFKFFRGVCALCHDLMHGFYDQLSSLRKEIPPKDY